MKRIPLISLFLVLLCFAACIKQNPQLPANKGNSSDASVVALQLANEMLIAAEDSMLRIYVTENEVKYTQADNGYWYNIDETKAISKSDKCKLALRIYSLDGELLLEEKKEILIAKKEVFPALDEFLSGHKNAKKASLIVPWYQAYGMAGRLPEVNAYQSIKVCVTVLDE